MIVLSGPSGVGKGTIAKELVKRDEKVKLSVSCTTRSPRAGEENGREYFFITKSEFLEKKSNGGFLEYSEHFENMYGTPRDFVEESLKSKDVILEIDVNGGLKIKEVFPEALLIMITPPSLEEIKNRLIKRSTESLDKINLRMERIAYELEKAKDYDYSVINDDLEEAVEKIRQIIKEEKEK